ncbi:LOW QUALITY PROTEIN: hypothetical protein HID58_095603 [Brassica napus]|uniref:RING-type E3 ubiquitin transferase n=1 Tax=Brassica napus TaxID=3708 RepID=A0ABQ7X5E3_BRANA|nr:LOW QUALITY PROTEIN: hypothetical protein HID58_095603 [Brassica napus]
MQLIQIGLNFSLSLSAHSSSPTFPRFPIMSSAGNSQNPPSPRRRRTRLMDFTNLDHDPDAFDPVSFIHSHPSSSNQAASTFKCSSRITTTTTTVITLAWWSRGSDPAARRSEPLRTPPASKSAVDALPTVKVTMRSEMNQCAVCMDEFEDGVGVKEMPCGHDCLIPWLRMRNTCPVCRHELRTYDVDYENRRRGGGEGERRFRRLDAGSDSGSGSDMDTRPDDYNRNVSFAWIGRKRVKKPFVYTLQKTCKKKTVYLLLVRGFT